MGESTERGECATWRTDPARNDRHDAPPSAPGSRRWSRRKLVAQMAAGVLAAAGSRAASAAAIDGEQGLGDPYFPSLGNSGYDAQHYDVTLTIDPERRSIDGVATITLTLTDDLRSFTFDLVSFEIAAVEVDGAPAGFSRPKRKLRIEPAQPLTKGQQVVVAVTYGGKPVAKGDSGWLWFPGGGALFDPQPSGTETLFPCNNHPSDKATFSFDVTTPKGIPAIANGLPTPQPDPDATHQRIVWEEPASFPTYAAVVAVGDFKIVNESGPHGLPIINALPTKYAAKLTERLRRQSEIISVLERCFGPFPYSSAGAIVTPGGNPDAMEAASRPTYPGLGWTRKGKGFEQTVAHELSHQWLGDAVSFTFWNDIWLAEGFATYGELLWEAHARGAEVGALFDEGVMTYGAARNIASERGVPIGSLFGRKSKVFKYVPAMHKVQPGDPGRKRIFNTSVYNRGALTLEALRRTVGDDAFYRVLRQWVDRNRGRNVTTADFIQLAEEISGQTLDDFFQRWLYQKKMPPLPKQ